MHHENHHRKAWLVLLVILTIGGLLAGRMRANAQSLDNDPAPATDSPVGVGDISAPSEPESIDAADAPADYSDSNRSSTGDSGTASENMDVGTDAAAPTMDSSSGSGSSTNEGAVLELPQVVDLQNPGIDGQGDGAVASAQGDDDTGQDSGASGELATAEQLGSLQDYENQANQMPAVPIFLAPGVAVARFPRSPFFNPPSRPLFNPPSRPLLGAPVAMSPILPPTSSGPFPSTSPMLMPPRFGPIGSFPRRGLMTFRR